MSKKLKTGLLIFLLGGPVFLLSFLYLFGENEYDLPVYLCEEKDACYSVDSLAVKNLISPGDMPSSLATVITFYKTDKAEFRLSEINDNYYSFVTIPSEKKEGFYRIFRVEDQNEVTNPNAVLLDNNQHIRGYYNLEITEEIDRMIKEVGVLLNGKYNTK